MPEAASPSTGPIEIDTLHASSKPPVPGKIYLRAQTAVPFVLEVFHTNHLAYHHAEDAFFRVYWKTDTGDEEIIPPAYFFSKLPAVLLIESNSNYLTDDTIATKLLEANNVTISDAELISGNKVDVYVNGTWAPGTLQSLTGVGSEMYAFVSLSDDHVEAIPIHRVDRCGKHVQYERNCIPDFERIFRFMSNGTVAEEYCDVGGTFDQRTGYGWDQQLPQENIVNEGNYNSNNINKSHHHRLEFREVTRKLRFVWA
eukprot:GHVR01152817.1.p1 GENE.GHVR01152817.1~~GHVR01152817.1.p1  ORF type:complete len:256 (+),score=22.48 GHVR01152817.1:1220-1987(+)